MLRSAAAAFLFLATAVPSHAFMAKNDLVVVALGADTFEVPYRGLSGASDFWCAAGDYVVRELNLLKLAPLRVHLMNIQRKK